MADKLTVRTDLADLAAAVQFLADNTDDTSLALFAADAVTQGDWVRFEVLLSDDTPVLEGVGRCEAFYDNGTSGPADRRYDVMLSNLQFDDRNEIMHERILLAAAAIEDDVPQTSQVDISQLVRKKTAPPPPLAVPRSISSRPARAKPTTAKPTTAKPPAPPPPKPAQPRSEADDARAARGAARRQKARQAVEQRSAARAARDEAARDEAARDEPASDEPADSEPQAEPTPPPPAPAPSAPAVVEPSIRAGAWDSQDETDAGFSAAPAFAQVALGRDAATREAPLPEAAIAASRTVVTATEDDTSEAPEDFDPPPGNDPLAQTRIIDPDAMIREARSSAQSLEDDAADDASLGVPLELQHRAASLAPRLGHSPDATLVHALRVGLAALEAQHATDAWDSQDD